MFLFSKTHKTPISTYTDSYRPPCSIKKTKQDQDPLQFGKENKFVTRGLTMRSAQNSASQDREQLSNTAMQDYCCNTIDSTAYWPEKYWLAGSEEKYNSVLVNDNKYTTWRTSPYKSAAWNKCSSYAPLLPKETKMETFLYSVPMPYPLKPTCPFQSGRMVFTDVLHKLSQHSPPSLQFMYTVTGKRPLQAYYSPSSGRHYCLHGVDFYVDGAPAIIRHLHTLGER
ncbi:SMRP1 protein, partial [Steatornis caripensis]|nr:SMRP1 protein [Steatornis caripensis]